MHFPALVVAGQRALGHFLHHGVSNLDDTLFIGRRTLHHYFEQVEQLAGIATAQGQQGVVFFEDDLFLLERGVLSQGLLHQATQGIRTQRLQHVHLAAREQGRNHLKRGVFGGGPNQRDSTVLHRAQQRILLGLAEAVNFINKQYRAALPLSFFNNIAHVFYAGIDSTQG